MNADLVVFRHTLEHIDNPIKYLNDIAHAAKYDAKIFIEVPNFEWIVSKRAFWDIFYEHCNYFTLENLASFFQKSEQGLLFNGQYMYLIADLKSLRKQAMPSNTISSDFNASKMLELYHSYRDFIKSNPRVLVWSAGAKGATFVNLTDPNKEYISCPVDINPKKQGRYIAKTGHSIISPAQLTDFEGGYICYE